LAGNSSGELLPAQLSFDIKIGAGGDSPGQRPSKEACPDCWDENWSFGNDGGNGGEPSGTNAPDGNGSSTDDGGGSIALPIVIGIVAAVVIIGGGAALFMRRRSSGG